METGLARGSAGARQRLPTFIFAARSPSLRDARSRERWPQPAELREVRARSDRPDRTRRRRVTLLRPHRRRQRESSATRTGEVAQAYPARRGRILSIAVRVLHVRVPRAEQRAPL